MSCDSRHCFLEGVTRSVANLYRHGRDVLMRGVGGKGEAPLREACHHTCAPCARVHVFLFLSFCRDGADGAAGARCTRWRCECRDADRCGMRAPLGTGGRDAWVRGDGKRDDGRGPPRAAPSWGARPFSTGSKFRRAPIFDGFQIPAGRRSLSLTQTHAHARTSTHNSSRTQQVQVSHHWKEKCSGNAHAARAPCDARPHHHPAKKTEKCARARTARTCGGTTFRHWSRQQSSHTMIRGMCTFILRHALTGAHSHPPRSLTQHAG